MNTFKEAARIRLRFKSSKGLIMVEDLYSLKITELDAMAISIHQALEAMPTTSFLSAATKADPIEQLKLDILLEVMQDMEEAKAKAETAAAKRTKNKHIRELIARKRDAALAELDIEALEALLEE